MARETTRSTVTIERAGLVPTAIPTLLALKMHDAYQAMAINYNRLLGECVFSKHPNPKIDEKKTFSFQRTLCSEESLKILTIVWEQSEYVTEQDRASVGHIRSFPKSGISCYGLAVSLAMVPKQVAAINSRIRSITIAGESYGLIDRGSIYRTKNIICGTKFLHDFMVRLGGENLKLYKKLDGLAFDGQSLSIHYE